MNDGIMAAVMLAELMNLGMAVMAAGDTVSRSGSFYLFIFQPAEFQPLLFHSGLEKTAAAAATIIVGPVGGHIHKVFFPDDGFDHVAQIFSNGVPKTLAHDLAGILDGKFNLQILVPIGVYFEPSLTNPFGIVFIDIFDDKVMLDVEFFQSCQD